MQGMGLQGLTQVHEAANFFGTGGELGAADQHVGRFGCGQVVADWTDATQSLYQHWQFPVGSALDEFFKATELDDVQTGLVNMIVFIGKQGDFAVAFNPGQGFDHNPFEFFRVFGSLKFVAHDLALVIMDLVIGKGDGFAFQ